MGGYDVKAIIKQRYDLFAERGFPEGGPRAKNGIGLAGQKLLTGEELRKIPSVALGYFMGATTPTRLVEIKEGEIVLDLGCGVGVDALLAAHKTGPRGKVYGLDLSEGLVARGKEIASLAGLSNVEFICGDMECLPFPPDFADTVISNGAINLVPDKRAVFREVYRVLKPGGKLAVCDIVLGDEIDSALKEYFRKNLAGCLAFSVSLQEYTGFLAEAGFTGVSIVSSRPLSSVELEVMTACPDPALTPPPGKDKLFRVLGKVISIKITAFKDLFPRGGGNEE